MKVLIVGAHPDDIEICCGGTIARFKKLNYKIDLVITVPPSTEVNPNRNISVVTSELNKSSELLQIPFKTLDIDYYKNGRPALECNVITVENFEKIVDIDYDLMIIPNSEDSHKDHKTSHDICMSHSRFNIKEIWEVNHPLYCHAYKTFLPNLFVDITEDFNFKLNLLNCYKSYLTLNKIDEIIRHNYFYGRGKPVESYKILRKNI